MRLSRSVSPLALLVLLLASLGSLPLAAKPAPKATAAETRPAYDPVLFSSLEWREVGPYRGGRVAAVTGLPGQPKIYYQGATGGGVWKTTDGGLSWKNVSDGFFGGSIGAVAVSEWDPNVIYVGTGEVTVRGNVSSGDGMWKSTDAGKTWKHVGLADSRLIPRVRIHPKNPDLVYAAVLGHLFGPNDERGVYRSVDGGKSWQRILFVNDEVGAVDLAMDPGNPRVLYASTWRVTRTPYSLESGGPGSGLWKSTDGGDNWTELTRNPGLPKGPIGIIGITVSPSRPDNLYAIVEAEEGGVFRSRDAGKTWELVNSSRDLRQRAWYYSRLYADPADEEGLYVVNVSFHHSVDGGRSFKRIRTPHGDNHDLWIAPEDPQRMIESNDGGANVSTDGGRTWTTQANQPTAQMYRVSADNDFPYRLLGGQQDNSALRIRSRSRDGGAIGFQDWEETAGGESGFVVAAPDDPDVVYGGSYGGYLARYDHKTGETRMVNVWPDDPIGAGAVASKYRFQWNYPLLFSPHDPKRLYAAANVLFQTTDGGASWQAISPDLTRDDESKQGASGGPITKDNTGVEVYCTIFALAESPLVSGVLWTGSDDGLIHVTRDGGASWQNVTPKGLPEWAMINAIDASPFEPGAAYVAAIRYKLDDDTPYLYATHDYGATWKRIDDGIPRTQFTRVVRADPGRKGLLYAGTEQGMYISFDDGARWQPFQLNLPPVPVTDLLVKDGDLIAATQGRGYWILDDLTVLHQLDPKQAAEPLVLFRPRPAVRRASFRIEEPQDAGKNPLPGVAFHYLLREEPGKDAKDTSGGTAKEAAAKEVAEKDVPAKEVRVQLEILDDRGEVIRTYTRKPAPGASEGEGDDEDLRQVAVAKGGNHLSWDLSYPVPESFPGMILWNGGASGPLALPGHYQARLTVGEHSATVPFEVVPAPNSQTSAVDRQAQFDFVRGLRDKLTGIHREIRRIREVRGQIDALVGRLEEGDATKALRDAAKTFQDRMKEVEEALYQTKNRSAQDPLNYPVRLNDKLAGLLSLASTGEYAPTRQAYEVRDELVAKADAELAKLAKLWAEDLPALNRLAREAEVPAVSLGPLEPKKDSAKKAEPMPAKEDDDGEAEEEEGRGRRRH